jgi:uncharacterized FlaG/YvyC family protein
MSEPKLTQMDNANYPLSTALAVQMTESRPVDKTEAHKKSAQASNNDVEVVGKKEKSSLPVTNNSDVFLRFRVDGESHHITVFVIDRESRRVVRSIPPEELNKMQAGDLLELMA